MTDPQISTAEVLAAYFDCREHKRSADTTTEFEIDLTSNVVRLARELARQEWQPGTSMCFAVTTPKPREVWAARFRDRVVHHVIYRRLRPRFEPRFIATSFACIPGRGSLAAVRWAERSMRRATAGWTREAWALQLDVKNFFVSIDRRILLDLLLPRCHEPWLATAVERVFAHDVRVGAHFPGDPARLDEVPRHKSLWHSPPDKGLPIGNLTSQFAANVYMDVADQYVTRMLRPRRYGRYVDDLLLIDPDKDRLLFARDAIRSFLDQRLALTLHPGKTRLQPARHGVDFVGYRIMSHRAYVRASTATRAALAIATAPIDDLLATTNSYLGIARHADTFRLRGAWSAAARRRGLVPSPDRSRMIRPPAQEVSA